MYSVILFAEFSRYLNTSSKISQTDNRKAVDRALAFHTVVATRLNEEKIAARRIFRENYQGASASREHAKFPE